MTHSTRLTITGRRRTELIYGEKNQKVLKICSACAWLQTKVTDKGYRQKVTEDRQSKLSRLLFAKTLINDLFIEA